jgi:hypothetical protein
LTDDAFDAPNRIPTPRRQPQPGETLFEFYLEREHTRWLCKLRDHGPYGVEAQFWEHEEFRYSRRFDTRALAVQWAEDERAHIEKGIL